MTDRRRPSKPKRRPSHRLVATMVFGFFLGACAYPHVRDNVPHDSHQHRVAGDADSVVVTDVGDQNHAFPFAEQYCEGRGKVAKFSRMILYRYSGRRMPTNSAEFDCILTDSSRPALGLRP